MSFSRWRAPVALIVAAACAAPASRAEAVEPTAFTQLTGVAGCLMQIDYPVDHGCGRVGGLSLADAVTLSPDERFVYVASGGSLSEGSNGVAIFARDASNGALTRTGCVTASGGDGRVGSEGLCARGDGLLGAADIDLSPDGRHAYVAGSGGIAWLTRDAETGALTPTGCVTDRAHPGHCGVAPLLSAATSVAVSPDGAYAYAASPGRAALHALRRDPQTGALTPVQCVTETGADGVCDTAPGLQWVRELAFSPDGRALYAAGWSGVVAAFARDAATGRLTANGCLLADAPSAGPCRDAGGLRGAADVAVSPDGRDVYVAAALSEAVASFRVQGDGTLTQTGCLQRVPASRADGSAPDKRCLPAMSLWTPTEVEVSADGRTVFVGGLDTITSYRRNPQTGVLAQTGCAEEQVSSRSCLAARATLGVNALAATADGRNLYVTAERESAVTILGVTVSVDASAVRAGRAVAIALSCPRVRARPCTGRLSAGGSTRTFRLRPGADGHVQLRPRRLTRRLSVRIEADGLRATHQTIRVRAAR